MPEEIETYVNFRITSGQPEIIENEKGLLIDFEIIGTQVGAEELNPSLTVNFGDIEAGTLSIEEGATFIGNSTVGAAASSAPNINGCSTT